MKYAPRMLYGERKSESKMGRFTAILWHRIETDGDVLYDYIMAVHETRTDMACLFITSQYDPASRDYEEGQCSLCVFDDDGQEDLGASADWADEEKFRNRALQITMEKLEIDVMELLATGEVSPPLPEG